MIAGCEVSGAGRCEQAVAQTPGFRAANAAEGDFGGPPQWLAVVGIAAGVPPVRRERVRALWLGGEESVDRVASGRLVLRPPGTARVREGGAG